VHVVVPHAVPVAANVRQLPAPSHRPSDLHDDGYATSFTHFDFGLVSAVTDSQMPSPNFAAGPFSALVHASHAPSQRLSQQMPSEQTPDAQSASLEHALGVQLVVVEYVRHAPAPSHDPSRMHEGAPSSGHSFRGSSPALVGPHVPSARPVNIDAHA
jgi:hypothetical protein